MPHPTRSPVSLWQGPIAPNTSLPHLPALKLLLASYLPYSLFYSYIFLPRFGAEFHFRETIFTCDISPVLIFVMTLSKSYGVQLFLFFLKNVEDIILRSEWSLVTRTMNIKNISVSMP